MSRTRSISLSVVGALVLSGVVLVPAAVGGPKTCGSASTNWVYCYGNNEEMSKQLVEGSGGAAALTATIGGGEAKFECKTSTLTAELESSGKGGGRIALHECSESKPKHCRLTAAEEKEIELPFAESLTGKLEAGKAEAVFTGTGPAEEIYDITLEAETGECTDAGSYSITGKQGTELPGAETSAEVHEIVATKSLSKLKIGGNSASLTSTDKVKMSSSHGGSLDWYVGLGS